MPNPQSAQGSFEVKLTPQPFGLANEDAMLGRLLIEKQFHGGLEASSQGAMLTAGAIATGSAGYVAVEHVTGMLEGRAGGFCLQHCGTMDKGAPQLTITVVPGSGSGALTGLTGGMSIAITGGKHNYRFDYQL